MTGKDHARLAYGLASAPFGGQNHAFFMFMEKALNFLKQERATWTAFKYEEQQRAWERIERQYAAAIEYKCIDEFLEELERRYIEGKKLYD